MRHRITQTLLVSLLALTLSACKDGKVRLHSFDEKNSVTMNVDVADTPQEREKGLMDRTDLAPFDGMLFVFPEAQQLNFWMKNTLMPLEIMYFDANGDFVNALTMQPCTENPCRQYPSAALAAYALETLPGFREEHSIGVGWKLDLATVRKNSSPR